MAGPVGSNALLGASDLGVSEGASLGGHRLWVWLRSMTALSHPPSVGGLWCLLVLPNPTSDGHVCLDRWESLHLDILPCYDIFPGSLMLCLKKTLNLFLRTSGPCVALPPGGSTSSPRARKGEGWKRLLICVSGFFSNLPPTFPAPSFSARPPVLRSS